MRQKAKIMSGSLMRCRLEKLLINKIRTSPVRIEPSQSFNQKITRKN